MCGIFGVIANSKSNLDQSSLQKTVERLFVLSESRGSESAGIAIKNYSKQKISVFKKDIAASKLIKTSEYKKVYSEALQDIFDSQGKISNKFQIIAHSRLVTNGTALNNNNNQPVIKDGGVLIHNGIITNIDELWDKYKALNRQYYVDSELFVAMFRNFLSDSKDARQAINGIYNEMQGAASVSLIQNDFDDFLLATNNGSLYYTLSKDKNLLVFASERYILNTAVRESGIVEHIEFGDIEWIGAKSCLIYNPDTTNMHHFDLSKQSNEGVSIALSEHTAFTIKNYSEGEIVTNFTLPNYNSSEDHKNIKLLQYNIKAIGKLKRCTKCILPETFPFIHYDDKGVCNYCKSYGHKAGGGREAEFTKLIEKYRSPNGKPDCIVPFSGGRDSSYSLHYIVKELGMQPITYTYDWGMVTDLARRNVYRICGELGIEHILVSANIAEKRKFIRQNVSAWLKRPDLGMIPLFMAGDKQFFKYVNKIKKETGILIDIWSMNRLEDTHFKSGFCGVAPAFDKAGVDSLSQSGQMTMIMHYLKNFTFNPSYINSSLWDTVKSYFAYYREERSDFYQIFDYVTWNERHLEQVLFDKYDWELAPDTQTSWRIGDGTAPFYNYIYYTVAGFTETDTFRSNQIREGMLTRDEALALTNEENKPRYESLKWYLDTINIDFEHAIKVINNIPKLYPCD
jgi:glutamine---fructose-6-phosphate transaminase (isomerizing)